MNMDFIGFGDNRMQGEILEYGSLSEDLYIRLVLDGKRIVGANILDNYRISGIIKIICCGCLQVNSLFCRIISGLCW